MKFSTILLFMFAFCGLSCRAVADGDPEAALLNEHHAFRIDPSSPYGKGLLDIYHAAWTAAVDQAQDEYEVKYGKGKSPAGVDFAVLRSSPPPVDFLSSSDFVAHFKPGTTPTDRGRIVFSSGFAELLGNQRDAIAAVFAHESRHALQTQNQLLFRATAEDDAVQSEAKILNRAGYNPRGSMSVIKVLPKFEALNSIESIVGAIDSHKLPHIQALKIQDEIDKLPRVPPRIDPKNVLDPSLPRYRTATEVAPAWQKVWAFVTALPDETFFQNVKHERQLQTLLIDVPTIGQEELRFHEGALQPLFEVFEYILEHHAKTREEIVAWAKLFGRVMHAYHAEMKIFLDYDLYAKNTLSKPDHGELTAGIVFSHASIVERPYGSLDFLGSMARLVRKEYLAYLKTPESQWTLANARAGNLTYLQAFSAVYGQFWADEESPGNLLMQPSRKEQKYAPASGGADPDIAEDAIVLWYASAFRGKGVLQEALKEETRHLQEESNRLSIDEYLRRTKALADAAIQIEIQYRTQSETVTHFDDPVAFSADLGNRMSKSDLTRMARIWRDFLARNPAPPQQVEFFKSLLVLNCPNLITPVYSRLLRDTNAIGTFSLYQAVRKTARISDLLWSNWERLQGEDEMPTTVTHVGSTWAEMEEEFSEFVSKMQKSLTHVDDHFVPDQFRTLEATETLLKSFASPATTVRRDEIPLAFSAWLRPDVMQFPQDSIHPWLASALQEGGIDIPQGINVLSGASTTSASVDFILIRPEHYRFYIKDEGEEGVDAGGLATKIPSAFLHKCAREQLRIWEAFERGEALVPPPGSKISGEKDYIIVTYRGGDLGGGEFVYPDAKAKGKREKVTTMMIAQMLDFYGGLGAMETGRGIARREYEIHEDIASEMRKLLNPHLLSDAINSAHTEQELRDAFDRNLVDWKVMEEAKVSGGVWAFLSDYPELSRNMVFRRSVEQEQLRALERLRHGFRFDHLPFAEKMEWLCSLTVHHNGTFAVDQEILELFSKASHEELSAFLSNPRGKQLLKEQLFHPAHRIQIVAHAMRGLSDTESRAELASEIVPQPDAYREAWNVFLGDTPQKDSFRFAAVPLSESDHKIVQKHTPKKGAQQQARADEFFSRAYHGMNLTVARLSDRAVTELAWYLTHPELHPLSPIARDEIREQFSQVFGQKGVNYALENEILRLYTALDPSHQRFYIYQLLIQHPTVLGSHDFRDLMKETPIFSHERYDTIDHIKPIVWNNMSWAERAGLTTLVLSSDTPKGTLADNDEMIMHNLEALGVPGRKLAQLLQTHGHFIRDSLRQKLGVFRDDNVHSGRLTIIEEAEKLFKQDLGLEFWHEVREVTAILGAGSVKIALHVVLKNGREAVIKLVDPLVKGRVLRNLELTEQSVAEWVNTHADAKGEHGIALYLMRRLRSAVEREIDLTLETRNTKRHFENITNREAKHATPITVLERLCSPNLNTVEYIPHRGNASRVAATPAESGNLVHEVLQELLVDGFVHGDLVNRANVLLLADGRPPALIDLSLSQPVSKDEVLLTLRLFQRLPELATQMHELRHLLPSLHQILDPSANEGAALDALNRTIRSAGSRSLSHLSLDRRKELIRSLREKRYLDALETAGSSKAKNTLKEIYTMLDHMVTPMEKGQPVTLRSSLDASFEELWTQHETTGRLNLTELVLSMEKRGWVFQDRYLFLFEIFSLLEEEERLALRGSPDTTTSSLQSLAGKVRAHLKIADAVRLKGAPTRQLIRSCEAVAELGRRAKP